MWSRPPRCWPRSAASRSDEIARQTTENFFRLFTKVPRPARAVGRRMTHDASPFSAAARPAACRAPALGWGACDPNNPKNRRRRCSLLVERRGATAAHARAGRHLAGPARAAARRRASMARRRALSPTSMPTTPTASTTCARCSSATRRRVDVYLDEPTSRGHRKPLRLLLRDAARQRLSADPDRAPADAGQAVTHRRGRAAPIEALPVLQDHGDIPRSASASAASPIPATSAACRRRACRRSRASTSGSSTRCATRRTRAISASASAGLDRAAEARRAILTNLHSDLDYEALRARAAGARRAGLRRPDLLTAAAS